MEFRALPIGVDNFKKIIDKEYYYVDKTLLIKEILDNKADVNLFTRPRRFGKTLNISMIQYFFENRKEDNKYLFENLNIMKSGEKYVSHMGQYPVINLSLKSAKQPTFELAYSCLKDEIVAEFRRHDYILESDKLTKEKHIYEKISRKEDEETLYVTSLKFLCGCLEKYHEKKVIVLIDEYDVPLENAFFEGFYDKMIKFIRSLFESVLKTNNSLEFAVITGCLRISKESIFTGLNNLNIISILNTQYAEHFGFTHKEVHEILKYYNLEERYDATKSWYNGYIFGETNVYNPWSVIKFVFDLRGNKDAFPSSYWANTSSNSIVKSLIEKSDLSIKKEIETLIEGNTIEKPVHEDITYDEIYNTMDNLYNFMFFTGYFKKVSERISETNQKYLKLEIPNEEIRYIFRYKVLNWFQENIQAKDLSVLYTAIINGDTKVFQSELNKLLRETISFNDAYENFYHGFIVGVLANMHDYIIKSNRECGDGRSDVYIKSPSIFERSVIIELKVCNTPKEIFTKCDEALEQIKVKRYEDELRQEGYENIIKYGIAFYRKDCLIKIES